MAVTDQLLVSGNSMFGIGLQAAKGAPRTENARFRWLPFTSMPYGLNQPLATLPPEAGRSVTPRGAYKNGVWGDGQITLVPRFVGDIADLLVAAMGQDAYVSGTDGNQRMGKASDTTPYADTTLTGSHLHRFVYNTNECDIPYITTRRVLEGFHKLGEQVQDNRISSLELTIPNSGPVTAAVALSGRVPNDLDMFVLDPDTAWGLNGVSYEADEAFAVAVDPNSVVFIAGAAMPCSGVTVTITNALTSPDQTKIIGAYTPYDYAVLNRAAMVRATVLVTDYKLYRDIYAGAHTAGATKFSSAVVKGNIDVRAYSPLTYASGAAQYAMQVRTLGTNIAWALPAPLPMNPQAPVILTLAGTVLRPSSGNYLELRMQNAVGAAYTPWKNRVAASTLAFNAASGNHILDSGNGLGGFAIGDRVAVKGSESNDGVYTVTAAAAGDLTVTEPVAVEAAGSAIVLAS